MMAAGTLSEPRVERVLAQLHGRDRRQRLSLIGHFVRRSIPLWFAGRRLEDIDDRDMAFLRDKLIALDPDKGRLCYLLCRALTARRVVEVGTSFGVSTIYLAAAVRDNIRAAGGGDGLVIGSEIDAEKARRARENLTEAGLDGLVDIREGDARESLKDTGGPVDFLLIDTWIKLAKPILEIMAPQLRDGAIVACDNVQQFRREYQDYLDYVRDPVNGFFSMMIPQKGGLELSVRLRSPHGA